MLTRACAHVVRANSRAATNLSAWTSFSRKSRRSDCRASESRRTGRAADGNFTSRGTSSATAPGYGNVTSRDGDRDVKPRTW
jgi:hypothetical protein